MRVRDEARVDVTGVHQLCGQFRLHLVKECCEVGTVESQLWQQPCRQIVGETRRGARSKEFLEVCAHGGIAESEIEQQTRRIRRRARLEQKLGAANSSGAVQHCKLCHEEALLRGANYRCVYCEAGVRPANVPSCCSRSRRT